MRQIAYLGRLIIVLLVLAPSALPTVVNAASQAQSRVRSLVPARAVQEAADLAITALNCSAGVVPDVGAAELEILGEEAC